MLLTLAMFPILVRMYVHLARQEEREALSEFGEAYRNMRTACRRSCPAWLVGVERSCDERRRFTRVGPHPHEGDRALIGAAKNAGSSLISRKDAGARRCSNCTSSAV
jgi:hypothetical protein